MMKKRLAKAFTAESHEISLVLISDVAVSLPEHSEPAQIQNLYGLWDTGATTCAIKHSIAKAIGAQPNK
jgi:hypothetical protein